MSDITNDLRKILQTSAQDRIAAQNAELARPKVRPITYQGDRMTQELGNEVIENGVPLNNASNAIGDPMMPLAKGGVLKRIDNINVAPDLGTALRDGLERDGQRGAKLSKNGGGLPEDPNDPFKGTPAGGSGGKKFPTVDPPDGCFPVSPNCSWSPSTNPPRGYQSYGSVDTGSQVLYLYCKGVIPPDDLGCDFLKPTKWKCSNGGCVLNNNGTYDTQAECEAARIPPIFTGGQCLILYTVAFKVTYPDTSIRYWLNNGANTVLSDLIGAFGLTYLQNSSVANQLGLIIPSEFTTDGSSIFRNGSSLFFVGMGLIQSFSIYQVFPLTGNTDNCGDLPYTCP